VRRTSERIPPSRSLWSLNSVLTSDAMNVIKAAKMLSRRLDVDLKGKDTKLILANAQ